MLRDKAQIVSEVTLYLLLPSLDGSRAPGCPIGTVTTFAPGSGADPTFTVWNNDGLSAFDEVDLLGVHDVLDCVRGLRRTAQADPERFACVNRLHSGIGGPRTTLVA